jgi:hypothetical protein
MLKTLDKRISQQSKEINLLDVEVDKKLTMSKQPKNDFIQDVKASYQKLTDLIRQRNTIKSNIVKSNALTTVRVAGGDMTVAQAIERKSSIIFEKNLLNAMRHELAHVIARMDLTNNQAQARLDKLLESTFSKDSTKVKPEEFESVSKPFLERNQATLVDPLDIRKVIESLEESINNFEEEVDIALSESNAVTLIFT